MTRTAVGASLAVALLALTSGAAAQQGFEGRVGRFYQDDGWTVYRLGVSRPLAGPIGTTFHGDYFRRVRGAEGALAAWASTSPRFRAVEGGPTSWPGSAQAWAPLTRNRSRAPGARGRRGWATS
jgi:hypothetical protein